MILCMHVVPGQEDFDEACSSDAPATVAGVVVLLQESRSGAQVRQRRIFLRPCRSLLPGFHKLPRCCGPPCGGGACCGAAGRNCGSPQQVHNHLRVQTKRRSPRHSADPKTWFTPMRMCGETWCSQVHAQFHLYGRRTRWSHLACGGCHPCAAAMECPNRRLRRLPA